MPALTDENANLIRAGLLFAADKYRRYSAGLQRFDDPAAPATRDTERKYRALAASLNDFDNFDAASLDLCERAMEASIDEMNRKAQALSDRCQMQDAAVTEHRVREMYAAAEIIESRQEVARAQTA